MLPFARRVLTIALVVLFVLALLLIYRGSLHFFRPSAHDAETLTIALYILSTLVQSLAAALGVTIAVLFIAAQFGASGQYVRSLVEIYRQRATLTIVGFFVATLAVGLLSLGALANIVRDRRYWVIDLNLALGVMAMLLLLPLVLVQIENLNPYFLAIKLARRISIRRILGYGLVSIEEKAELGGRCKYKLIVWGHQHGREDPLGPFHEIVMIAVRGRDRLQVSALTRILFRRVAQTSRVPYKLLARSGAKRKMGWFARLSSGLRVSYKASERLAVTLHILHYSIRRCENLRQEWGAIDSVRQQYLLNLADLISALSLREENRQAIEVCLFAMLHFSLAYGDVPRLGEREALTTYFQVAESLFTLGMFFEAELCAELLGVISVVTWQLPLELVEQRALRSEIATCFYRGRRRKEIEFSGDPWRDRLSRYKLRTSPLGVE